MTKIPLIRNYQEACYTSIVSFGVIVAVLITTTFFWKTEYTFDSLIIAIAMVLGLLVIIIGFIILWIKWTKRRN